MLFRSAFGAAPATDDEDDEDDDDDDDEEDEEDEEDEDGKALCLVVPGLLFARYIRDEVRVVELHITENLGG